MLQALALGLLAVGAREPALGEARRAVDLAAALAVGVGREVIARVAHDRRADCTRLSTLGPVFVAPLADNARAVGTHSKGCTTAKVLVAVAARLEESL